MKISLLAAAVSAFIASEASAHYHMLIPERYSVKMGEEAVITYQFGHPFEHQLFDASPPSSARVILPDGKEVDVRQRLKKIEVEGQGNKKVAAFRLLFQPEQRGDHVLVFMSPPVAVEGEKKPVIDVVKVVLHVQTQQGWDAPTVVGNGQHADLRPLTRPYGLRPGMLFRAMVADLENKKNDNTPLIGFAQVEYERYNPEPPKGLPPDEHITYTARTDDRGVLAVSLPEAGWWAITSIKRSPKAVHRCTFWVPVDGKIPLKPAD